LECAVVLFDLLLRRLCPLLRDALDLLRETLGFRQDLLHGLILAQRLRRTAQRLVFVGLAEHATQVFRFLFEH